ncbi:MAG TPA: hypothetical protein VKB02_02460 [Pyrinomonadaceae bacterium]|nr:hypothetical protein [Pyrinomonadaceae bacterium]
MGILFHPEDLHFSAQLRPLAELKDAPEILEQLETRRTEFEQ